MTPTDNAILSSYIVKQAGLLEQLKAFATAHPEALTGAGIGAGVGGVGAALGGAGGAGTALSALGGAGAGGLLGEYLKKGPAAPQSGLAPLQGPYKPRTAAKTVKELRATQGSGTLAGLAESALGRVAQDTADAASEGGANLLNITIGEGDRLRAKNWLEESGGPIERFVGTPFDAANAEANLKSTEITKRLLGNRQQAVKQKSMDDFIKRLTNAEPPKPMTGPWRTW